LIAAESKETAKASILAPLGLQLGNTEHLIPHQHIRIPPKDTGFPRSILSRALPERLPPRIRSFAGGKSPSR
jgi:hypothetical protein